MVPKNRELQNMGTVLDFLLEGAETGLAVSMLKAHTATLSFFLDMPLGENR